MVVNVKLEEEIVDLLKKEKEMSFEEIHSHLSREKKLSEREVKETIWELLLDGKITPTKQWRMKLKNNKQD